MYIAVRQYKVKSGSIDEIVRRVNEGYLPIIGQVSGFIAWYAVDAGNDIVFSVSIFQDQAGADASTRLAADWVKQNLAALVEGPPEITTGEVKTYKAT